MGGNADWARLHERQAGLWANRLAQSPNDDAMQPNAPAASTHAHCRNTADAARIASEHE